MGFPGRFLSKTAKPPSFVMASAGKSEKVTFENASGEKLVGRLHTFADRGERVSILCHGFRNTKDSRTIKCVADALHAKGE